MAEPAKQRSIDVGDTRITYLPDGYGLYVPSELFPTSTPEAWKLHREWLDAEGRLVLSFGSLLVQTGDQKMIVDTGWGDRRTDAPGVATRVGGSLLQSLAASGFKPEDIDIVFYTHLHHDHVGWTSLAAGDQRVLTFPNARHLVRRAEWDHWRGTDSPPGPGLLDVQRPLEGRIEMVEEGQVLTPAANVIATPGHTPGHSSVVVSSGGRRAIILGDVVHCPAQLDEASWSCIADVDPALGRRTREALWKELEDPSTVAAGGHFSDFTFGRVLRAQGRLQWRGGVA